MTRIYFLLIIMGFSSISCKKALDIEPMNSITFGNIRKEKDIESLMYTIDNSIRLNLFQNIGGIFNMYFNGSDIATHKQNDLQTLQIAKNVTWNFYYQIIHQANIPLRFLDQTDMTEERKNYYRGRAYFYKAFAYLWLIRNNGDAILIKDDVILDPVSRTPWPEVADYAIDLAEKAVAFLPEYRDLKDAQGNKPINKFAPAKGPAYALLADLTAWKAGVKYLAQPKDAGYDERALWQKSADACTKIIESGQYSLAANPEQVCESVLVGDSQESIYEKDLRRYWDEMTLNNQGVPPGHDAYSYFGADFQPQHMPDPSFTFYATRSGLRFMLVDSVKKLFGPNDLRRNSYFYKIDSLSNVPALKGYAVSNKFRKFNFFTSGIYIGKFSGLLQNVVLWRLAGIYLLRAECRARLGETAGAIADLNVIRARAKATPYQSTEGDLRYAIYEEMVKKELLFEPYSFWFNAVRNGYVRTDATLKSFGYDRLSNQDLIDGALFGSIVLDANNPLLRQNVYWNRRFSQ